MGTYLTSIKIIITSYLISGDRPFDIPEMQGVFFVCKFSVNVSVK
jgi:hypothetical protein